MEFFRVLFWPLFNIYINDVILIDVENILLYADDMVLIVKGTVINEIVIETTKKLNHINKWFRDKCFPINYDKTKYMIINRKNKNINRVWNLNISIDNIIIQEVDNYKYLGIYIDNKWNLKHHQRYRNKKITYVTMTLIQTEILNPFEF